VDLEQGKQLARDVVELAKKKGAETVSVTVARSEEFSVSVRQGEIELLNQAGASYLEAEVNVGQRSSTVHTCDLGEASIAGLLDEALALARHTEADEFNTLPDREELGEADADLDLYDPRVEATTVEEKTAIALEMEKAALAADPRIIPDSAGVDSTQLMIARANSLGFCGGYKKTAAGLAVSCVVEDSEGNGENTGRKQSGSWVSTAPHWCDLEAPGDVARTAVERVLRKLGAVKPKTQSVPVVFDPLTAASLVRTLASAASGGRVYQKLTYLAGRLGQRAGSEALTMVDDPLIRRGHASRLFDGEGVRSRRNLVLEAGVLKSYFLGTYSANKLGMKTTGSSGGTSNFHLFPGVHTPEEIIASVDNGLYITSLSGQGTDLVTGDYSRGAQGLWIEGGKLSHPVSELTIASTLDEIYNGILMVGNDLRFNRSVVSPTLKVEQMTVSGS
jgi:PmbA protein